MDRKSHPFTGLAEHELDAIISRAHRERAIAIAAAARWAVQGVRRVIGNFPRRRASARASAPKALGTSPARM